MSADADPADPTAPARPRAGSLVLAFEHRPAAFAGIAIRNAVLGLMTLGLYRFWAKVAIRRHLWRHVRLLGEPLEYLGAGKELLLGFLVALTVFLPVSVVFKAAELVLIGWGRGAIVAKDVVFVLSIFFLIQFAIHRARGYRLSRTMWRGVRAGQSGGALGYALAALGYGILTGVTLGLAYPVYRTRLFRLRMDNTWFGDRRFRFDGGAGPLALRWLAVWAIAAAAIGSVAALSGAATAAARAVPAFAAHPAQVVPLLAAIVALLVVVPAYLWYRAAEFRYFASRTLFEGMRFRSTLPTGRVILTYLTYLLGVVGLLNLTALVIAGFVAAAGLGGGTPGLWENVSERAWLTLVPPLLVSVIGFLMGLSVLNALLVVLPTARWLCATLSITGDAEFVPIADGEVAADTAGGI